MWVTKLLISPVKNRIFCSKTTKFGPKLAFLFILGQTLPAHLVPCWWVGCQLWRAGCISQDTFLLCWAKNPNVYWRFKSFVRSRSWTRLSRRTLAHQEVGGHYGRKSRFLAPLDIPDISGYQLGIRCQFVEAYNNENPVTNCFVSNLDICKIVIVCPGQHHVKAQVWSFENVREKQK